MMTHIVRPGDSLGSIASQYGTTVTRLMSMNGITNPNMLYVGQALRVPTSSGDWQQDPAMAYQQPYAAYPQTMMGGGMYPGMYSSMQPGMQGSQSATPWGATGQYPMPAGQAGALTTYPGHAGYTGGTSTYTTTPGWAQDGQHQHHPHEQRLTQHHERISQLEQRVAKLEQRVRQLGR